MSHVEGRRVVNIYINSHETFKYTDIIFKCRKESKLVSTTEPVGLERSRLKFLLQFLLQYCSAFHVFRGAVVFVTFLIPVNVFEVIICSALAVTPILGKVQVRQGTKHPHTTVFSFHSLSDQFFQVNRSLCNDVIVIHHCVLTLLQKRMGLIPNGVQVFHRQMCSGAGKTTLHIKGIFKKNIALRRNVIFGPWNFIGDVDISYTYFRT